MRLNKFIASRTSLSRRAADTAIANGQVKVNGAPALMGQILSNEDTVTYKGKTLGSTAPDKLTILLNKPVGVVCSKNGQGSNTIYDILPEEYKDLNPAGRLDKESSGLLLLTNDGHLANDLTHPKSQKVKIYMVTLDKDLAPLHQQMITDNGVLLHDGVSKFSIEKTNNARQLQLTLKEGRNRQIRRTFDALGYEVINLHRTTFGPYSLGDLKPGETKEV